MKVVIKMFVDTHCHIYKEYYENMDSVVKKINDAGISKIINNGCDHKSNEEVLQLIKKYNCMYGAIGIHPDAALEYTDEEISFIEKHINDDKVVAIGEIGLDYYWTKDNKKEQIELFEKQLTLALKYNKPVIIHSREATKDTIDCLKKYPVKGVIHCFSGSYETACIYIKMGFLLGVNGVVTFKNCNLKDVLCKLDLANIVLETDSPYLTPVPYRGEQNDSSHIIDIAKFVSEVMNVSMDKLAVETNANVKKCFDINVR